MALSGDTVLVQIGIYNEHLSINKPLSLIGQAMNCTLIRGNDSGTVISITSPHVVVKKLTVIGSGDFHEEEQSWDAAIKITEADSCMIESCRLIDNGGAGIALSESSYCILNLNQIRRNHAGIYFYESSHYPDIENTYNQITENHITDNTGKGIILEHTLAAHHRYNTISHNEVSRNGSGGISMIMCYNNNVLYNQFSFNSYCFFYMECTGGGGDNLFHHNIFQSPDENTASFYYDSFMGVNFWNQASPCEGNYWANYTGTDSNGDGIGDTEYSVGGPQPDYCPLISYPDDDSDGIADFVDNCPYFANPNQSDMNGNGVGDVCDAYICGDANGDKTINIGDGVYIINYVFRGGNSPNPEIAGDANCDEVCNVGDAVYIVNYVFRGGLEPCCP